MRCECELCYTLVSSGNQNRNFRSLAHAFVCDVKTKTNFTISLLIDDDQHLPLPLLTPNTSREHKIVDLPSNRIAGAGEIDFFVDQNPFESIYFVAKHWKFSSECCVWRCARVAFVLVKSKIVASVSPETFIRIHRNVKLQVDYCNAKEARHRRRNVNNRKTKNR